MHLKTRKFLLSFLASLIFLSWTFPTFSQDLAAGEQTFKTTCSACHALGKKLVGPDLTGVKSRWKDGKKLIAFVQDPNKYLDKDPYVMKLQQEANGARMAVPPLSEKQVQDVLAYANSGGNSSEQQNTSAGGNANTSASGSNLPGSEPGILGMSYAASLALLLIVLIVLIAVAVVLYRVRRRLKEVDGSQLATEEYQAKGWWARNWGWAKENLNPTLVVLGIVGIIVLLCILNWYHRAQDLGTQVGYAPEQPIKFNHKLHAGQYGIKCQYCHTGVDKSRYATIPSLSTCMNCHDFIEQGPQYGKEEVSKLVAAYKQNKPVKWIRIHNLPDHVYFNHSQHIVAGKLTCDRCHGAVQEMERVQQVATLEMGWCVNCHRETGIDSKNPYYTSTFDFIKKHKKYTVAQMGGIECIKCHY